MGLCAEVYTQRTSWRQLFRGETSFFASLSMRVWVAVASRKAALNRSFLGEDGVKSGG
jgi:hypothetical protein